MAALVGTSLLLGQSALAQRVIERQVSPEQRAVADRAAQSGVALADLAPNAPDDYVVRRGDTLWDISKLFLRSPWRWPELWGMNRDEIRNPHLIYPGQSLYLDKSGGTARLRSVPPADGSGSGNGSNNAGATTGNGSVDSTALPVVKLSPRIRSQNSTSPLAALQLRDIEPFLAQPLLLEVDELKSAPRIVAGPKDRVIMGAGDRIYARGPAGAPLVTTDSASRRMRIFHEAKPLTDPDTKELLGFEAVFIGSAQVIRDESTARIDMDKGAQDVTAPATLDLSTTQSAVSIGDRLAHEPAREVSNFVPRAPDMPVLGRVVSIYGESTVVNAVQNQVIVINRGKRDSLAPGMVLALRTAARTVMDSTMDKDAEDKAKLVQLPEERNGLLMVFRVFDKVSYGLILESSSAIQVGDRITNPR